jgi:hypothetical protein
MSKVSISKPHQARDTAWKDILDAYFKEFVDLCLPDLYVFIDWQQPWTSLDKEFHAITKDGLTGKRLADKLAKVYLKTGEEQWVLIHLEIQGEPDALFPKRMLTYAYRIYDKYDRQVVSCAILADTNPHWRPNHYEVGLAGSSLRLDYRVVKLLDYQGQKESLDSSSNPFASVILSHLAASKVKNSSAKAKLQAKLDLTKRLYLKGYTKEQVIKLYLFIDWLLHLPEALEIKYKEEVYQLEAAQKMAYISTIERFGIKKGIQQGEQELLLRQLQWKFHSLPESYCQKLAEADQETLLLWGKRVLDAKKLEDIFED